MLNRRILRIKAFKVMYENAVKGGMNLNDALAELDRSCEATRDLYLYMLSIVLPLTEEAGRRIEAAKTKFNPTEEDLNPNMKFAQNALAKELAESPDFLKILKKKSLSWDRYDILIRHVYDSMLSSTYFSDYMANPESSLAEDCALFIKVFEKEFEDNAELHAIIEDLSIYWMDELGYVLISCCKTLKEMAKGSAWSLPELYQSDQVLRTKPGTKVSSDRAFVCKLLTNAIATYESTFEKIVELVPDWDKERLFSADMAIIALGVSESSTFSDIPRNVTLNEYIEISKFYCSPKSRQFVNGLLNKLTSESI